MEPAGECTNSEGGNREKFALSYARKANFGVLMILFAAS
jgi:hypothetical protein